jgi:hypothetical protein
MFPSFAAPPAGDDCALGGEAANFRRREKPAKGCWREKGAGQNRD